MQFSLCFRGNGNRIGKALFTACVGYFLFGAKVEETMSLINKVSIGVSEGKEAVDPVMNEENKIKRELERWLSS